MIASNSSISIDPNKARVSGEYFNASSTHEFQMALMNRKLDHTIQTVFLMTDYKWLYLSSTIVRDVAKLDGDLHGLVHDNVRKRLREKMQQLA